MKKSISVLLSLLVILCGIPFTASAETANVVDVQIVWDEMCFVYTPKWDYVTCTYVDNEGGWKAVGNANRIFVNNLSAFEVTVSFGGEDMSDGITFNFYDSSMNPLSPGGITLAAAEQGVVRLLPYGILPEGSANDTALGKVVIHISANIES